MVMPVPKTSQPSLGDLILAINWLATLVGNLQTNDAHIKTSLAQLAADNTVATYVAPVIDATAPGSLPILGVE